MASEYPDTTLRDDVVDPLYGGRPGAEFGALAWTWCANVLQFLGTAFLTYNRAPYTTQVVVTQQAVAAGEWVVFDASSPVAGGGYRVRKVAGGDAGSSTAFLLGLALEPAAAGARVRVASGGLIPRTITGLAALAAGAPVTVDYASARLRAAAGGEVVVGYGDTAGNVLLLAPARFP